MGQSITVHTGLSECRLLLKHAETVEMNYHPSLAHSHSHCFFFTLLFPLLALPLSPMPNRACWYDVCSHWLLIFPLPVLLGLSLRYSWLPAPAFLKQNTRWCGPYIAFWLPVFISIAILDVISILNIVNGLHHFSYALNKSLPAITGLREWCLNVVGILLCHLFYNREGLSCVLGLRALHYVKNVLHGSAGLLSFI